MIDIAEMSPENGLEWCHLLPTTTCQILVAGGDGTIGWKKYAPFDVIVVSAASPSVPQALVDQLGPIVSQFLKKA